MEIRTEAAQFLLGEYINRVFFAVCYILTEALLYLIFDEKTDQSSKYAWFHEASFSELFSFTKVHKKI